MPLRPEWLVLYGAVAVLYLFVAWREWLNLESESARPPVWHGPVLALAIGLHGVLLVHGVYVEGQLRFGFAHALSATLWITAIIIWVESFFSASRGLFLLVLPLAAVTTLLPAAYPGADPRPVHRRPAVPAAPAPRDPRLQPPHDRGDAGAADGLDGPATPRRQLRRRRAARALPRQAAAAAVDGNGAVPADRRGLRPADGNADQRRLLLRGRSSAGRCGSTTRRSSPSPHGSSSARCSSGGSSSAGAAAPHCAGP